MEKLKFDKMFLLQRLNENRKRHETIFEEAIEGYRTNAVVHLEERLEDFEAGKDVNLYFTLDKPSNHLKDYDRVIMMIEHSVETEIELTESEYAHYVMDDWSWQRSFMTSNSFYSTTATSGCLEMGY
jgi:hypothetical protein